MNKYRYAQWAVLAAMMIFLCGCASASVSSTVEPDKTWSEPSSSLAGYTEPESELDASPVHTSSEKPTRSLEATPIPSSEPASASDSTTELPVAQIPSSEPASAAGSTAEQPVVPIPSSESASAVGSTPELPVMRIPSPDPVPVVSPTSAPAEAKSDFIYPVRIFNDETRICLTFDDGGNKNSVKKALEVLKEHEVKCTFFVIGKYLKSHEALWKQAIEDGHIICNHTQNHLWLTQLNDEDVRKEILEWESTAAEILGQEYLDKMKQEFPFIRLPGGAGNESKRVLRIVSEFGYIPVGWNIESYYAVLRHHDLKSEPLDPIADEVFAHISKKVKGGSIILLHFNPYDTAKLDEIIAKIKEKGLTMHLLSECLEY